SASEEPSQSPDSSSSAVWFRGQSGRSSLAHVRDQRHEPGALHRVAGCALERRAIAAALAGEHLALVGAKLLEQPDVLVVDIRRARASVGGAEPAPILPVPAKSFPRHKPGVLEPPRSGRSDKN